MLILEIRSSTDSKGENIILHSGDFKTPKGIDDNVIEINKRDRAHPRGIARGSYEADQNQIMLYIPPKPGAKTLTSSCRCGSLWERISHRRSTILL